MAFEVAKNYFIKNDQAIPASSKITTEEEFNKLFGMATTMGERLLVGDGTSGMDGKPTEIDFSKQFVLAIVLPVTDIATEITPVKLEAKGDSLFFTYDVKTGEKQSFTIQPFSIIILDRKFENNKVILINEQLMQEDDGEHQSSMKEVQAYLKECGAFFIATADGEQPHVRPFGVSEIIETLSVKEEFLNRNESLKSMYKADDDNMSCCKSPMPQPISAHSLRLKGKSTSKPIDEQ